MKYPTPDLCDEYRDETSVFPEGFINFGRKKFLGAPAKTVRAHYNMADTIGVLKSPGEVRVFVLDPDRTDYYAVFGGKMAHLAMESGWAGIIVNGYVRDSDDIASLNNRGQTTVFPWLPVHGELVLKRQLAVETDRHNAFAKRTCATERVA